MELSVKLVTQSLQNLQVRKTLYYKKIADIFHIFILNFYWISEIDRQYFICTTHLQ
jgi:hypothetical protein